MMPHIYILHIEHRHGSDINVFPTRDEAFGAAADYARENWQEAFSEDDFGPEGLSDIAVVHHYFDAHDMEYYTIAGHDCPPDPEACAQISSLLHQIEQMRGLFSDEDGSIQEAISSAEEYLS